MRLGLQKTSLIDFPGRVACVAFLPGCDLSCPFCHNPELAKPSGFPDAADDLIEWEEALAFLEKRKGVLGGIVFSGGEPLLSRELPRMVAAARALSYAVKIDTNGMRPDAVAKIDADFVALDLKTVPRRYAERIPGAPEDAEARIRATLGALRERGMPREMRTTLAPGFAEEEDLAEMGRLIEPGEDWVLQRFRPGRTLDPAWSTMPATSESEAERLLGAARSSCPQARIR